LRVKRSGTNSKGPVSTGVPMCRPLGCVRLLEGCQMPSRALRVSAYGLPSTAHFCTNALCWLDLKWQRGPTSSRYLRTLLRCTGISMRKQIGVSLCKKRSARQAVHATFAAHLIHEHELTLMQHRVRCSIAVCKLVPKCLLLTCMQTLHGCLGNLPGHAHTRSIG